MADFVPVEVYALEGERLTIGARKDKAASVGGVGVGGNRHGDEPKERRQSETAPSRQSSVVQSAGLPPLPGSALALKSFLIHGERDLFAGRHDGAVAHWQIQHSPSLNPPPVGLLHGHAGAVLALDFATELGRMGLLLSSSVDRTIKLWDPWSGAEARFHYDRGTKPDASAAAALSDRACVQTLIGHDASVTSLKVLAQQHHALVSCSLDRSVRTWLQAEGRTLLLYPLYVPGQIITLPGESWPTSLCVRAGALCSLFVADSAGCISLYTTGNTSTSGADAAEKEEEDAGHSDSGLVAPRTAADRQPAAPQELGQLRLKRRFTQFHSLGVSDLQLVADGCFVVSLGFDEKAQVIDTISGALSSTIPSPSGARFTSCCWDARGQMLLLGDSNGTVHLWSVLDDRVVARKRLVSPPVDGEGDDAAATNTPALVALKVLATASGAAFLFAGLAAGVKQWFVNRDIGYTDYLGHTQGIVAIVIKDDDEYEFLALDDSNERDGDGDRDRDRDGDVGDEARLASMCSAMFFSASLDSTIRCWDALERKASFGFEERASEITCMVSSKKFRKLFTGHDSGVVKAWGVHTGESVQVTVPGKRSVTCLASGIVRDQELLVTGDVSGAIWIWEVSYDRLKSVGVLGDPARADGWERVGEVTAVHFSEASYLSQSGDEFVVAGYVSGSIRIWSVAKKTVMSAIQAHSELVTSLIMHGCFLFSSSDDMLLRIWNLSDPGEPYELGVLRPPAAHGATPLSSSGSDSPIVCLDVAQSLGLILSAAADGTLLAWDYSTFEDERAFEAYGKIVFRAKADERVQCLRYWPAERAVICGTVDGRLLAFKLPQQALRTGS